MLHYPKHSQLQCYNILNIAEAVSMLTGKTNVKMQADSFRTYIQYNITILPEHKTVIVPKCIYWEHVGL